MCVDVSFLMFPDLYVMNVFGFQCFILGFENPAGVDYNALFSVETVWHNCQCLLWRCAVKLVPAGHGHADSGAAA